jgi:hypothetical protein
MYPHSDATVLEAVDLLKKKGKKRL